MHTCLSAGAGGLWYLYKPRNDGKKPGRARLRRKKDMGRTPLKGLKMGSAMSGGLELQNQAAVLDNVPLHMLLTEGKRDGHLTVTV